MVYKKVPIANDTLTESSLFIKVWRDDIRIDKLAAGNARMPHDAMIEHEINMFPDIVSSEDVANHIHIRNTILRLWYGNPYRELAVEQIYQKLKNSKNARENISKVFEFLVRYGYINFGLFKYKKEPSLKTRKKVIIIGAGLSGICAARQLLKMGIDVIILEASNRVGGRIHTVSHHREDSGHDFVDLGASTIRFTRGNPLSTVLQQLNCTPYVLPSEFPVFDHDGKEQSGNKSSMMKHLFNHMMKLITHVNYDGPILDGDGRELDLERSLFNMTQALEIENKYARKSCHSLSDKLSEIVGLTDERNTEIALDKLFPKPCSSHDRSFRTSTLHGGTQAEMEAKLFVQEFQNEYNKKKNDRIADLGMERDACSQESWTPATDDEIVEEDMKLMDFNKAVYEGQHGAPLSFLSSKHCNMWEQNRKDSSSIEITEGLSYLMKTLTTPIKNKIILGCRVAEIDYTDNDLVRVKCLRGESKETFHLSESHVLVTVPLGVLKDTAENKEDCIKFNPPLPDVKIAAIKEMGWGHVNKIAMCFESLFWKPEILSFGYLHEKPAERGKLFYFTTSPGSTTLTAQMSGQSAIYDRTNEEMINECIWVLKKIFGEENVPAPVKIIISHWHTKPNIKGAMSFLHPGSDREICDVLARTVLSTDDSDGLNCKPKVYFAGEHTCKDNLGTLEGAWHSGVREAAKIAAAILGSPFESYKNLNDSPNTTEKNLSPKLAEQIDNTTEFEQARSHSERRSSYIHSKTVEKTRTSRLKLASTIANRRETGEKDQSSQSGYQPKSTVFSPSLIEVVPEICSPLDQILQSGVESLSLDSAPSYETEPEQETIVLDEPTQNVFKAPKVELAPSMSSRNKLAAKKNDQPVPSLSQDSSVEFSPAIATLRNNTVLDHGDVVSAKRITPPISSAGSSATTLKASNLVGLDKPVSSRTLIMRIKKFNPTDKFSIPTATIVSSFSGDIYRQTEPDVAEPSSIPLESSEFDRPSQINVDNMDYEQEGSVAHIVKALYWKRAHLLAATLISCKIRRGRESVSPSNTKSKSSPDPLVRELGGEYMKLAVALAKEVLERSMNDAKESVMRSGVNASKEAHTIAIRAGLEFKARVRKLVRQVSDEYIKRSKAYKLIAKRKKIEAAKLNETKTPTAEIAPPIDIPTVQEPINTESSENATEANDQEIEATQKKKKKTKSSDEDVYFDWSGRKIMKPRRCAQESAARIREMQNPKKKERAPRKVKTKKTPEPARSIVKSVPIPEQPKIQPTPQQSKKIEKLDENVVRINLFPSWFTSTPGGCFKFMVNSKPAKPKVFQESSNDPCFVSFSLQNDTTNRNENSTNSSKTRDRSRKKVKKAKNKLVKRVPGDTIQTLENVHEEDNPPIRPKEKYARKSKTNALTIIRNLRIAKLKKKLNRLTSSHFETLNEEQPPCIVISTEYDDENDEPIRCHYVGDDDDDYEGKKQKMSVKETLFKCSEIKTDVPISKPYQPVLFAPPIDDHNDCNELDGEQLNKRSEDNNNENANNDENERNIDDRNNNEDDHEDYNEGEDHNSDGSNERDEDNNGNDDKKPGKSDDSNSDDQEEDDDEEDEHEEDEDTTEHEDIGNQSDEGNQGKNSEGYRPEARTVSHRRRMRVADSDSEEESEIIHIPDCTDLHDHSSNYHSTPPKKPKKE